MPHILRAGSATETADIEWHLPEGRLSADWSGFLFLCLPGAGDSRPIGHSLPGLQVPLSMATHLLQVSHAVFPYREGAGAGHSLCTVPEGKDSLPAPPRKALNWVRDEESPGCHWALREASVWGEQALHVGLCSECTPSIFSQEIVSP